MPWLIDERLLKKLCMVNAEARALNEIGNDQVKVDPSVQTNIRVV